MSLPLIPRRTIFGNRDRGNVRISPDGRFLAWWAPLDGVMNLWVAPRDDVGSARPVTRDRGSGVYDYQWAFDGRHILYLKDKDGDENWHIFVTDLEGSPPRDITPYAGARCTILKLSERRPAEVLVGMNDRDPSLSDAWAVDIKSGERSLVVRNEGFVGYEFDLDFTPRLAVRLLPDGTTDILMAAAHGDWEPWDSYPHADSMTTTPIGLDESGKVFYLLDARGRNTAALYARDLGSGESRLLAEDSRFDLSETICHPATRAVQAVCAVGERKRWMALDASMERDLSLIASHVEGDFWVHTRSMDDRWWTIGVDRDDAPLRYYLYDRDAGTLGLLFSTLSALEGTVLSPMRPLKIKARDGLELVCYCSLPLDADSDGDGIPDAPLPLVLLPHGGPWWRDSWGFRDEHQWLSNRGYAVLSVNFRGSTGFGKDFVNAGNREWGGKILEDQLDAVDWVVKAGIADPKRLAVLGTSFGGYSALALLSIHPEVFRCGVDVCGPANLETLLATIPEYWKPIFEDMALRVGDPRTDDGRELLRRHSPLNHGDRIRAPLLVGQGANDPRVKRAEADQIVEALKAKGIPVTYVLYPDEGHGFTRPENRLSFYAIAEAFLARALGGRLEPVGTDFEGSSIQVLEGSTGLA